MNSCSLRLDRTKFTFNSGMTEDEGDAEVLADEQDEETRQVQFEGGFIWMLKG